MAFLFIPSSRRRQALADLYAFCRVADDIADHPGMTADHRHLLMKRLEDWVLYPRTMGHPFWDRFLKAKIDFEISTEVLLGILKGVAWDIGKDQLRFETWSELEEYIRGVACCVGEATLSVLGANDPRAERYADQMGKCLQFLNIMRDLDEDRKENRVYVPLEFLRSMNLSDLPSDHRLQNIRDEIYSRAMTCRDNAMPYSWRCLPAELMASVYIAGAKKYWRHGNPKRLSNLEKVSAALLTLFKL